MNGKIKTEFAALFAVALMITVCVVPVVGNDYGEAEAEYIPSSGYEFSSATVSGVVLDKNGTGISGAEVTVSGPSNGTTLLDSVTVYTNSTGAYTAQVQWPTAVDSSSPVNLTVTLSDEDEVGPTGSEYANPAKGLFSTKTLTFTGVTDGYAVTGADFKAGFYVIPGQIYYENGVNSSGAGINGGEVKEGATLLLKNNGSLVDGASIVVDSATGAFNVYVPSSLSLSTGDELTITGTGYESAELTSIPSSFVVKKTGIYLAVISVGTVVADDSLTIAPSPATQNTSAVAITTTSVMIDADDVKPIQIVYTLETGESKTDYTVKLTSSAGYGDLTLTLNKAEINYSGISYNQTNYVSGTVSMAVGNNVVYAAAGGTVTLTFYEEQTCTNQVGNSITGVGVLEGGKYVKPYGSTYADAEYVKVTYSAESPSTITSNNVVEFKNGFACTANVSVDSTGYNLVYGKVLNERNIGIKGVTVGINDANAFGIVMPDTGNVYTVTTDDNGSYAIFTKADIVTITPNAYNNAVTYDIGSVQKEVNGNVSQNFIMKDKIVKITVTDDTANKPMQGVSVKYAVAGASDTPDDEDYTAATVKTNADGKIELVFNGNAFVSKNLYLKAEYEGRTFNVLSSYSSPSEIGISTNDAKYTVDFISNDKSADITGLTLPTIVKGTVTKVPSTGTETYAKYEVEEYGALTLVDAKKGEAFFYGPSQLNGFYLDFGSKTFGKYYVSEYMLLTADNEGICSITLNEYIAKGLVQNQNGTAISEAKVTIYKGDVAIGNGVTNSVGYFEFPATQALTNATVEIDDVGYYTFNNSYTYTVPTESTVPVYYANEYVGKGTIQDASYTSLKNSKITVTSKANEDGPEFVSKVDADGEFKYLVYVTNPGSSATYSSSISAVDENGVYTFDEKDVTISTGYYYVANEKTYVIEVAELGSTVPAEGVSVDLYQVKTNDAPVLIKSGLVTDEEGEIEIVLDASKTYEALPKSVEYGLQFSKKPVSIDTTIVALNNYIDLGLKSANVTGVLIDDAEYVVSSYMPSGAEYVKVGEATAVDGKVKIIAGEKYTVSSPEGAHYTFGSETEPYVTPEDYVIKANEAIYKGNVTSDNDQPLKGIEVTLEDDDEKIVGTGITDEDGAYEIVAIGAVTAFAADAELDIGKFTFDADGVTIASYEANIEAEENLYSGYYADGAVVKDVEVSYMDSDVKSLAKVIDNKYYIVTETNLPNTTEVTATAPNFNAKGTLTAANVSLEVGKVPTYDAYFMPSMGAQILGPYNDVVYGTVLTLVAQNEYSIGVPEEDGVIQKYKFAGWYVNGEKVSDDLVTTYTVNGDCTIYADYKVSSYVAAPADESNGLSMDVLVLGIVIVVLGLLAFAYAVKFKKE